FARSRTCVAEGQVDADDQSTGEARAQAHQKQDQEPGADAIASETWSLHPGVHDDAEKAEFSPTESCAGEAHEWHGGHDLHSGRWAQLAGTLHRPGQRRARQRRSEERRVGKEGRAGWWRKE